MLRSRSKDTEPACTTATRKKSMLLIVHAKLLHCEGSAHFICHRRPSARLIPWHGIGMREKASVLSDLSNVLGAVGLSHPKRVLKKVMFQYTKATRQVGRFFQERLRVTDKISPFIQVFVAQRRR